MGAKTLVTMRRHCVPWGSSTRSACPNNNTYHLQTICCSPSSLLSFLHPLTSFILTGALCLRYRIASFPGSTNGKEPACQCRRHRVEDLIPGSGRSPEERHGKPLQYSCLEKPMDRGAWQATVLGPSKSQTRLKRLSMRDLACIHHINESLRVREAKNLLLGPQPVL